MTFTPETTSLTVKLVPTVGQPLRATFFLRRSGSHETLGDRLNDADTEFLPAEIDGKTEMVRLSWIAYIEIVTAAPEVQHLEELGAQRQKVALRLATGNVLIGEVLTILPPERSRISDLLNVKDWRFLLLDAGDRVCFVHRDAIATVRQLE